MNIHFCSFASKSFENKQKLQANHLLKIGFDINKIHLFNPEKLNRNFYELQPNASEENKFGWFAFKPFMILSILEEIDQSINKADTFIVPMDEQRHSFEFYSSKLYGQKLSILSDGCRMFIPDIFNYSVYKPNSKSSIEIIQQALEVQRPSKVFLIGIELKGTDGDIRHAEDYFSNLGYKKYSEQQFDIGMLLIKYKKHE